jgi:hypothetical protein
MSGLAVELLERSELLDNGRDCVGVEGLAGLIGLLRRLMLAIFIVGEGIVKLRGKVRRT